MHNHSDKKSGDTNRSVAHAIARDESKNRSERPANLKSGIEQKQPRVNPAVKLKNRAGITDSVKENDAEIKSTPTPVQRMLVVAEKDYKKTLGKGNESVVTKIEKLIAVMGDALKDVLGKGDTITIEIINNGEMSPAWNHHKGSKSHPGVDGDIGVQLNKWYLEKVSLGDLLGMFIHEIGVHTLADRLMGAEEQGTKAVKGTEFRSEYDDQGKEHKNSVSTIENYPNDIESDKKKGRSRQRDHVNLAKSLSGGKSTRAKHYVTLYLQTGDSVDATLKGKEKDTALKDLTQSFLFDIARLAATDDGNAVQMFWNTENIGQLMDYYKKNILEPKEGSFTWLKAASTGIKTGKWEIRGWLLSQIGSLLVSSNPGVQTGRSVAAGVGTALYVGGGIVGALSVPAIATGIAVGLTVYGIQKLFGY